MSRSTISTFVSHFPRTHAMVVPDTGLATNQREKVTFEPNTPVTVTLKYSEGKIVAGRLVMYSLEGNQVMFVDMSVAQKIDLLEVNSGESVTICKRWNGQRGSAVRWDVWLSPATEKTHAALRSWSERIARVRIKTKIRSTMLEAGWDVTAFWEHARTRLRRHGDYRACWGCTAIPTRDFSHAAKGFPVSMACWGTMRQCARFGISVKYFDRDGWSILHR